MDGPALDQNWPSLILRDYPDPTIVSLEEGVSAEYPHVSYTNILPNDLAVRNIADVTSGNSVSVSLQPFFLQVLMLPLVPGVNPEVCRMPSQGSTIN
jgi:hypothetical protein